MVRQSALQATPLRLLLAIVYFIAIMQETLPAMFTEVLLPMPL